MTLSIHFFIIFTYGLPCIDFSNQTTTTIHSCANVHS